MFGRRLSPIAQRRWTVFRSNRLAFASLIGIILLTLVSLSSPLIANDRPLLIIYEGKWYFPTLRTYSGGDFGFRLPGLDYQGARFERAMARANATLIWPPIPYRFDTLDQRPTAKPSPPEWQARLSARRIVARLEDVSAEELSALEKVQKERAEALLAEPEDWYRSHWLGTDSAGRDIIARFLWALAVSLLFGMAYVALTSTIGITVGALQGYYGGWVDIVVQRVLEVYGSLPTLFIMIALVLIFGSSFGLMLTVLVAFGWTAFVGITRVEFLRARNLEFVRAARALGVHDSKIMRRHILPNAFIGPITLLPFIFAGSVTVLSSLDFLGFGLPRTYPSLGEMAAQASRFYYNWWQVVGIVVPLSTLTLLFVFVGDGVRQAFDPRALFSVRTQ